MLQNGVKLNDRVYFMDGAGLTVPKVVTYNGTPFRSPPCSRARPRRRRWGSPTRRGSCSRATRPTRTTSTSRRWRSTAGLPAAWDSLSWVGTNNEVTGPRPDGRTDPRLPPGRHRADPGIVPPGADVDTDMFMETLTEQVGCTQPHTIIALAREHHLRRRARRLPHRRLDGQEPDRAWRDRRLLAASPTATGSPANGVSCGTFLDYLIVTVNCTVPPATAVNFTLVCDLNTRSWFRFTNFPATCYIPSESAMEQSWAGHLTTNRLVTHLARCSRTRSRRPIPLPDYVDGNGVAGALPRSRPASSGSPEEGMERVRQPLRLLPPRVVHRARPTPDGIKVEYRTDPPTPEDIDLATGRGDRLDSGRDAA